MCLRRCVCELGDVLRHDASVDPRSAAAAFSQGAKNPLGEKLHFYAGNAFRELGAVRGFSQLALLLLEKKLYPYFNQYALLPDRMRPQPQTGIEVRSFSTKGSIAAADLQAIHRESTTLTFSWLRAILEDHGTLWLGHLDGRLAAFCCTRLRAPATAPGSPHDAYLFAVEIVGRFRRRKLAVPFLHEVCQSLFANGVQRVWSETHLFNRASNRMHRRLGFEFRSRIRVRGGTNR